ncbi:MAG: hypothetical protein ABIG87_00415 [Patescibacteria group bacterium]
MSFTFKYKKIICSALIVSFIMPVFFLSKPNTAQAFWGLGSIVNDPPNTVQNTKNTVEASIQTEQGFVSNLMENRDWIKEYILDPIAWMAAKIAIRMMTTSIVNWINGGFDGSPSFITDYKGYFKDVADAALGEYINGTRLQFLCSPFKLDVLVALNFAFSKAYEPKCTLSGIVGNVENAIDDLEKDWKWGTWISMTASENNNAYGAFVSAHAAVAGDMQNALEEKGKLLDWGNGFFSWESEELVDEDGVELNEDQKADELGLSEDENGNYVDENGVILDEEQMNDEMLGTGKVKKKIKTPGSVISSGLNKALGAGQDSLVTADEIDEIIGALLAQLMQRVIGPEGLLGQKMAKHQGSEEFGDLKKRIKEAITTFLEPEEEYNKIKNDSLDRVIHIDTLLLNLISCWESKIDWATDISYAHIDLASSTLNIQIKPLKDALTNDVKLSQDNINALNNVQQKTDAAETINDLQDATDNLQDIYTSGNLHHLGDVSDAKIERDGYNVDIEGLDIGIIKTMDELENKTVYDPIITDTVGSPIFGVPPLVNPDKGILQNISECKAFTLGAYESYLDFKEWYETNFPNN